MLRRLLWLIGEVSERKVFLLRKEVGAVKRHCFPAFSGSERERERTISSLFPPLISEDQSVS